MKRQNYGTFGRGPAIATDNASNIVYVVKEAGLKPKVTCLPTLNIATQHGLKFLKWRTFYQRLDML